MSPSDNCGNCIYYQTLGSDPMPQCIRRSPQIFVQLIPAPTEQDPHSVMVKKFTAFPAPEPTWKCGDHKAKPRQLG
jgi:hypothetical protein